jgi:hypothetical protein
MPDDTGYSYSSHVLTQWTILWDQCNRQRLHYPGLSGRLGENVENGGGAARGIRANPHGHT